MPNRILRDWDERLREIEAELSSMPKATGENHHLGVRKWKLYSERRNIRMRIARGKGRHTFKEAKEVISKPCVVCGSTKRVTRDHKVPVSKGGDDSVANLQPMCIICNSRKGNKDA